jgi:poly(3-hydroxybutyrate) depolymerase/lysophospholipase L1-like esterase
MKKNIVATIIALAALSAGAQIKVACIGNSITQGSGGAVYPTRLQSLLGTNYQVQNDGVSGTTVLKNGDYTYWAHGKLADVFSFKPNIVTIKLGTNDTKPQNWDTHSGEFKRDYLAMIDTLNTLSTRPRIFLVLPVPVWPNYYGIRDSILKKTIVIIRQIANERGLPIIDCNTPLLSFQSYFSDGVHPNDAGADSIAHIIYRSIAGSPSVRFQFRALTSSGGTLPYRLFVPENYSRQQKYPLILTLHGVGESGTDNIAHVQKNRVAEIWAEDSTQKKQMCFVVSPQCPTNDKWVNVPAWTNVYYSTETLPQSKSLGMALAIVDSLIREFPIDTNRLYITGLSMGGFGTWDVLARHPGKFAAAIPLCGGSDTSKVSQIKNTPVWTFHGAVDGTVPPAATRSMIALLESHGCPVIKYTAQYNNYFAGSTITRTALTASIDSGATTLFCEYPDGDHGIWTNTYNEPLIARWLFKQKKQPPVAVNRGSRFASRIADGSAFIPVFTIDRIPTVSGLTMSSGKYEVRIFDLKGSLVKHSVIDGAPDALATVQSMLRMASGIRWLSLKKIK